MLKNTVFLTVTVALATFGSVNAAYNSYSDNSQTPSTSSYYHSQNRNINDYDNNSDATLNSPNFSRNDSAFTNRSEIVSDQDLTKKIRDKIGSGWFSRGYEDVQVAVNNGNVTLAGTVRTIDDKQKVEKEVRKIDGVKNVDNRISVQEEASKY